MLNSMTGKRDKTGHGIDLEVLCELAKAGHERWVKSFNFVQDMQKKDPKTLTKGQNDWLASISINVGPAYDKLAAEGKV